MAIKISESADINSVQFKHQASNPTAPASGYVQLFARSNDCLYMIRSSGSVLPVGPDWRARFDARLTLTSGLAVTTADVTAATNVYLAPFRGNQVMIFDGTEWVPFGITERTLSLAGLAADTNYDVFVYDDAGTITLEAVAWTNATTRATALTTQDGVLVKSGATTNRYCGTIRTTATTGQCEDSLVRRFVWNCYHRLLRPVKKADTTASWTYNSTTPRQTRAQAANKIEYVCGLLEEPIWVSYTDFTNTFTVIGIGINSTSTFSVSIQVSSQNGAAIYTGYGQLGYNYVSMMEMALSGTITFYGSDTGRPEVCYLVGHVMG